MIRNFAVRIQSEDKNKLFVLSQAQQIEITNKTELNNKKYCTSQLNLICTHKLNEILYLQSNTQVFLIWIFEWYWIANLILRYTVCGWKQHCENWSTPKTITIQLQNDIIINAVCGRCMIITQFSRWYVIVVIIIIRHVYMRSICLYVLMGSWSLSHFT